MKVGDIVICHGYKPTEKKLGFVEEIIFDGDPRNKYRAGDARYSIYGLSEAQFQYAKSSFYFGDYLASDLESTGDVMTLEGILDYARKTDSKGIKHFITKLTVQFPYHKSYKPLTQNEK